MVAPHEFGMHDTLACQAPVDGATTTLIGGWQRVCRVVCDVARIDVTRLLTAPQAAADRRASIYRYWSE